MAKKSIFDNPNSKQKRDYVKFENVGDGVEGIYVDCFINESDRFGSVTRQENYVLLTDDGKKVVGGRNPDRDRDGLKVLYGMKDIPYGAVIGIKFEDQLEPKEQGMTGAKIVDVYYDGEVNEEALTEYKKAFRSNPEPRVEEVEEVDKLDEVEL